MPREKSSPHRKSLPETQQLVKEMCPRDNYRTQNEFIEKAIRFYAGYVSGQDTTAYLPPALASVLRGTVQDTENRVCPVWLLHQSSSSGILTAAECTRGFWYSGF